MNDRYFDDDPVLFQPYSLQASFKVQNVFLSSFE